MLEQKAARAEETGLAYEALAYGLETNESTPGEEWLDLVGSTERARALADRYGKLLLMGPGFRLMSENEEMYTPVRHPGRHLDVSDPAAPVEPAGRRLSPGGSAGGSQSDSGRQSRYFGVGQNSTAADREPDAAESLSYRRAIANLVDGAYMGVYTWRTEDADRLVGTVEQILQGCTGLPDADTTNMAARTDNGQET